MAFSLVGFLKGIVLEDTSDRTKQLIVQVSPSVTTGTSTTITTSQTANRTITFPDNSGTVLTTGAAIPVSDLAAITPNQAVITDGSGYLTTSTTTATELSYVHGVTSNIQTQLNMAGTNPMTTLGDMIYENATPAEARLAGNTTTTKQFLTQTGTGSVSAAPAWGVLVSGDIPNNAANTSGTAAIATTATTATTATNIAGGTGGSVPYQTAANTTTFLPIGTQQQYLQVSSGSSPQWNTFKAPTIQSFLSVGTGLYSLPIAPTPTYIRVRMVGSGGGGGGSGSGTTSVATAGGATTFGTGASQLSAGGGSAGVTSTAGAGGGGGGTATLGTGSAGLALNGANGGGAQTSGSSVTGGGGAIFPGGSPGGNSAFGGGGSMGAANASGGNAVNNTGGGGGGAGAPATNTTGLPGSGGGAGAFIDAIIAAPSSSYSYTIHAPGAGGVGTSFSGGSGALGFIEVTEFYQ